MGVGVESCEIVFTSYVFACSDTFAVECVSHKAQRHRWTDRRTYRQSVAVLGKNIWGGAWPLIIWKATTAKRNYYRTNLWCIAKNLGGYTLETRRRAASAER